MHLRLRPIKNTNKNTTNTPINTLQKYRKIFCQICGNDISLLLLLLLYVRPATKKKHLKKPKKKNHTPHTLFLPRVRACLPACVCVRSYRVYAIYAFVSDQPRDALTLSYASNLYWPMASRRAWPHSHPVAPRPMLLKLPTIRIMAAPVAPTCRHI